MSDRERGWIALKWEKIRESQQKADRAANEWTIQNDAFNSWLDRTAVTDPVQRAARKGDNLALKDALATHDWHSKEASRHLLDLQVFLKMKEMGL